MSDTVGPPPPIDNQPNDFPAPNPAERAPEAAPAAAAAPATAAAAAAAAAPAAPAPPTPPHPNRLQLAAAALRPVDWVTGVLTGVAAFVVAYIVAVVSLLLTTAFVVAGSHSSTPSSGGALGGTGSSALPTASDLVTAVTVILGAPAQLVVLGDLGRLSIRGSITTLQTISGSVHFGFVPVLVLAAQLAAIVLAVRLFRSRRLDLVQSGIVSVVAGATLAVVTLLVGLLLAIRLPSSSGLETHGITAVDAMAVIVALVVGSCVAMAARPAWLAGLHPLATRALGTVRVAAVHLGVVLVVIALAVVLYGVIARPSGAAAYPLVLGNIAVLGAAVGFLGGASLSESAGSLTSTLGGSTAPTGTLTVFSAGSASAWLLVLLAVVTAFAAGLALAVRRTSRSRTTVDWIVSVLAYAGVGLLLLVLGTVVFSVQIAAIGGSGSAGVTPWTIAVLAAWGAAIEAVARFVAPRLVPMAPAGLLRFTARLVGRDGVVERPGGAGQPVGAVPGAGQPVAGVPAPLGPDGSTADSGHAAAAATGTAAAYGAQPADAFAPATPMSPRSKKILVRSLIAAGIVVVVVVGGAITASTLRSTVYGPAHTAQAYLDALRKGDADAAGTLSGATGTGKGMLTDAIFRSATDRITDVAIGRASVSGDIATVAVSYRQAGKSHDASLRLTRTGTSWLVHDTWAVSTSFTGKIDVSAADSLDGASVTASGKKIGELRDGGLTLTAYPGTYDLGVTGSKYVGAKAQKVTVSADTALGQNVQFEATATPQLTTDATKVITDLITTCAKSTSGTLDESCPFYGPGADTTGVSYKVTKMPTLKVSLSYSGAVEVTGTGGSVNVKYTEDFGGGYKYQGDDDQNMYIYEELKVDDGKLVVVDR